MREFDQLPPDPRDWQRAELLREYCRLYDQQGWMVTVLANLHAEVRQITQERDDVANELEALRATLTS